jgi:deoxycytidylate deaminase
MNRKNSESFMSGLPARDLLDEPENRKLASIIADRLSQELVLAVVGPVGSGVSTAADYLKEILSQTFHYTVFPTIKISRIIIEEAHRLSLAPPPAESRLDAYVETMQTIGNELRRKFGGSYLAEKAIERIHRYREDSGGHDGQKAIPGRRAYIIDSLKNTDELELLRQIYEDTLCVFGVFAPDALRKKRLTSASSPPDQVAKIIDRDQNELATFGQKTRKVFVQSDFFVCNDQKKEELRSKVERYLHLIFDTSIHTPTRAEAAMYEASAAAGRSACMSRQVGAAIVSITGELIGVGWNDVPKFGGGLYSEDDQSVWDPEKQAITDRDNRCFKWGDCVCHNEVRRNRIASSVVTRLASSDLMKKGKTASDIKTALEGTEIDALIEFSRSIHAEMEAILSVAREGKNSLMGATLYTNTYPCHNCARHIVAAGITTVIYIEPYAKSLAIALHSDAITEDPNERKNKVLFRQYDGVAPRNYLKLFRTSSERKKDTKLSRTSPPAALPLFRKLLDAQSVYEDKVIADLSNKEHSSVANGAGGENGEAS